MGPRSAQTAERELLRLRALVSSANLPRPLSLTAVLAPRARVMSLHMRSYSSSFRVLLLVDFCLDLWTEGARGEEQGRIAG
eukprot:953683-Rhodomonas_salina.1